MKKNVRNKVVGMVKWFLPFYLLTFLPLSMMAQDDDLYFVPKKKAKTEGTTEKSGLPIDTYYSGSDRSVDEYNRREMSSYIAIEGDSTKSDIVDFNAVKGVYPDSLESEDYELTKKMARFDGYDLSNNEIFWAGYNAGRSIWGWHSPWYYSRYGWGWYDPWLYGYGYYPWYSSWWDPWYYGYGWRGWYDPWYYGYGWGYPYYGYYGYYGWGYPYYYGGGGGGGRYYSTGNAGTIDRRGSTHGGYRGRSTVAGNSQRMGSLRDRAGYSGGRYSSGNSQRSGSGNFSGRRNGSSSGNSSYSSGNSSFGGSRGGGSYSSGGGGRSGGGGYSGGGGGGSRSGGGGGHMGGRR